MSSARNHGLVPQSTGDTQYNVRDAALRGASLAFSKPVVKPKPQVNTYSGGHNGALLAATKVGTGRNSTADSPAPLTRDWTGGSSRSVSRPSLSPMQVASKSNSSNSLGVPDAHIDRVPSPSNIAARLAAARYSPLPPTRQAAAAPAMSERDANERDILPPTGSVGNVLARLESRKPAQQSRARRDSLESHPATSTARREQGHKPTDDTRIPPTTSLVKMFEQNRPATPTKPPTAPLNVAQNSPPPVRSPKPQRAFKLPPEPTVDLTLQRTKTQSPPPVKPKPKHRMELPLQPFMDSVKDEAYFNTPKNDPLKSPPIKQKPTQLAAIKTTPQPPKPPPQRGSRQPRPMSQETSRTTSAHRRPSTSLESYGTPDSPTSFKSAKEEQEAEEKPKPSLPPPRRSNTRRIDPAPLASKPNPTAPVPIKPRNQSQVPASKRSLEQLSPPRRPASATGTSPSMYHNNYQRQSVQQITKHMTGESLSSAIMGAALAASSRNASPAPRAVSIEPLFPPRKQHHHHSPFHRTPSPQKQSPPKVTGKMRTTMRKEPSSSEDEDEVERYKKKGTRIMGIKGRKHPNKHHEGTRKRWRDQITERERKRYEGVWAANKGLYLTSSSSSHSRVPLDEDPALDVLNLCVQEIWTRSRLPIDVLEEVWDLVDGRGIGRLSRYEFVVGLWLIDQRLKGRKLPVKVSDSVWASARGVGIKVKVRK
ncbi:Nn.00g002500.m01.CDS01 [Neocucurbitaria sp. VM-36]